MINTNHVLKASTLKNFEIIFTHKRNSCREIDIYTPKNKIVCLWSNGYF